MKMLMNVLCINITAHMDIDVRICLDHTGRKNIFFFSKMIAYFFVNRCIRERNCGTGYQVDPVTQTCMGKIFEITNVLLDGILSFSDVDECEQDIDECRQVNFFFIENEIFVFFFV